MTEAQEWKRFMIKNLITKIRMRKAVKHGVYLYGVDKKVSVGISVDGSVLVINDKRFMSTDRYLRPEDYGLTFSLRPF